MYTPAWQRLTDGTMRGRLANLRSAVTDLLAGNYLPSFTDHSVSHSDRLCDLIDKLTEPLTEADQLSDQEAFILYAAAYLHDAGLQHQRAGETRVVATILTAQFPGRAWADLDIETRRSIVRGQHHRISGEMITGGATITLRRLKSIRGIASSRFGSTFPPTGERNTVK